MTTVWIVLGLISVLSLILTFFGRKNAIWGGLTIGVVAGFIIAFIYLIRGNPFNWLMVEKATIIGTLSGVIFEILGALSDYLKKAKKQGDDIDPEEKTRECSRIYLTQKIHRRPTKEEVVSEMNKRVAETNKVFEDKSLNHSEKIKKVERIFYKKGSG